LDPFHSSRRVAGINLSGHFHSSAINRNNQQSRTLEVLEDNQVASKEDSLENVGDVDEELERQRDIWNVGPAFRPSFNLASFVNESALLQEFLKMGVKLHKWELREPELLEFILKLDFEKDVAPYVR